MECMKRILIGSIVLRGGSQKLEQCASKMDWSCMSRKDMAYSLGSCSLRRREIQENPGARGVCPDAVLKAKAQTNKHILLLLQHIHIYNACHTPPHPLLSSPRPPRICRTDPPHTTHFFFIIIFIVSSTSSPPPTTTTPPHHQRRRRRRRHHHHRWRWQPPCAGHPAAPHRAPCAAVVCSARKARLTVPCGGGDERRCGLCRVCAAAAEEQSIRQRRRPVHAQLGGGGRVGRQHGPSWKWRKKWWWRWGDTAREFELW